MKLPFPPRLNSIKVNATKINKHIFRIDKYDIVIVVSEKIKKSLEEAQLTGIKFELLTG